MITCFKVLETLAIDWNFAIVAEGLSYALEGDCEINLCCGVSSVNEQPTMKSMSNGARKGDINEMSYHKSQSAL